MSSENASAKSPIVSSRRLWLAVHWSLRGPLGGLFVYAAVAKLLTIDQFALNLAAFGVVPDALVVPAAWCVAVVELLLGLAILLVVRGGVALTALMIVVFLGFLGYGIALGLDIDCGCLGPGYHVSLTTQALIDTGLLLACFLIYWSGKQCGIQPWEPWSGKATRPGGRLSE